MKELTLKELQGESLKILRDVHAFCVQNDIRYSLYGGTLIGAIRHKGFIPWDDDIDIIMPRPDFERFCHIYESTRYCLISNNIDKRCYMAMGRVCDKQKTVMKSMLPWCNNEVGCWIDIFPADGLPDDANDVNKLYSNAAKIYLHLQKMRYAKGAISLNRPLLSNLHCLFCKLVYLNGMGVSKYARKLNEYIQKYPFEKSKYWGSLSCLEPDYAKPLPHDISSFSNCKLMSFENESFYVMNGYDEVLRKIFGDYLRLPPVEKRVPKQQYIKFYWKD